MRELGIDIETYSSCDLVRSGVYRYVEAPDFTVLLLSYSVDGGPVACVDLARGEALPPDVLAALTDPAVVKTAFNATFERVCLGQYLQGRPLDPAQWRCTMVRAARMGLPLSLEQCGEVLHLERGKMREGRALIRYFSVPCKGRRHQPDDDPERWETFKRYNMRDVEVEQQVLAKVRRLEVPEFDERLYLADQRINDRGVLLDRQLAEQAAWLDEAIKARLRDEAVRISGMDNPGSPAQIKEYLRRATGLAIDSLSKAGLDELERRLVYWPKAQRVLQIRREMGKTSNKKYDAMLACVCRDGRIRGLLQFYGAARTGRWAGRLVQVQNLPQNHLPDLDRARQTVREGDLDELELNYASPTHVLSELLRTAFIARPGCTLHVCDFSAIEARVIAWLAGERWVLDVFREGGDIYCATASQMFRCRVEKHGENAELRQKGKIAVLALGYGGGVAALESMGGSRLGLTQTEERDIMTRWRAANPHIVRLWARLEDAALRAIKARGRGHRQPRRKALPPVGRAARHPALGTHPLLPPRRSGLGAGRRMAGRPRDYRIRGPEPDHPQVGADTYLRGQAHRKRRAGHCPRHTGPRPAQGRRGRARRRVPHTRRNRRGSTARADASGRGGPILKTHKLVQRPAAQRRGIHDTVLQERLKTKTA